MTDSSSSQPKLDVFRYLSLFMLNAKVCCAIIIACAILAVAISYALPKRYQATSTISVEQSVISDLVKGIAVTPSMESKLRLLNVYLLSRNLLLKIASILDMDLDVTTPAQREQLVQKMRDNVRITRDEKRGLFYISYTDTNPVQARDFVNTMTRVYIEDSTATKRQESYDATAFLGEQIEMFQKRIEQAQVDIDAFKSEKGMYLGLNEPVLRQQIKSLEQRIDELSIRKAELIAKRNLLLQQPQKMDALRAKEMALANMRASYTDQHPSVIRLVEEIRVLRESLEEEKMLQDETTINSPEYQLLTLEIQSLEETENGLQATLKESLNDLQELPAIRTRLAELEQRKTNETHIYEQLVGRFGQSEVSKQMEMQDKSVTLRVIDAAVIPTVHSFPPRHLIILGGIVLGFALAAAWLVLSDRIWGRIRSAKDLALYKVKVLTKLPQLSPPDVHREKRNQRLIIAGTASILLVVCGIAAMEFLGLPYMEKVISRLVS